jgi:hypothetical protein
MLLLVLNKILERHNILKEQLCFCKLWSTVKEALQRCGKEMYRPKTIAYPPDPIYFSSKIKKAIGVHFPILELIADVALRVDDVSKFAFEPKIEINDKKERVFSNFSSALFFESVHNDMIRMHGPINIHTGFRNVAMCIAVTVDEAAVNKTKTVEPMLFYVQNIDPPTLQFVGIAPNKLGSNKLILHQDLLKRGCFGKGRRNDIIRAAKRDLTFKYFQNVLQPYLDLEKCGFLLKVSHGEKSETTVTYPYFSFNFGDNKSSDNLASVNSACNGAKCRICNEKNLNRFSSKSKNWDYRNHFEHKTLVEKKEQQRKQIFIKTLGKKSYKKTDYESKLEKEIVDLNIIGGSSFMFRLGDIYNLNGIHPGHALMSPPDKLHSFEKGDVENTLTWICQIIYALEKMIGTDATLMQQLDESIINFPIVQPIMPFDIIRFPNGISPIFKQERCKPGSASKGTGMATGGMPAHDLIGLLFQTQLGIGVHNRIIPPKIPIPDNDPRRPLRKILCSNRNKQTDLEWNVQSVILNACQSVIDVHVGLSKKGGYAESDISDLEYLIEKMRAHLRKLYECRNDLMQYANGVKGKDIILVRFNGHKNHLMEHMGMFMSYFAPDSNIFNTEQSEHFHIPIKGLFYFQ